MFSVISKCIHVLSLHGIFCFSSWPRKPMMSFRKTEKKGKERGKGNTCIHADSLGTKNLIAIHKIIQFSHIIHILISINQIQLQVQWQWSMLHQNDRTVGHACNAQSQSLIPHHSSLIISTTNKSKHTYVHDINTAKSLKDKALARELQKWGEPQVKWIQTKAANSQRYPWRNNQPLLNSLKQTRILVKLLNSKLKWQGQNTPNPTTKSLHYSR